MMLRCFRIVKTNAHGEIEQFLGHVNKVHIIFPGPCPCPSPGAVCTVHPGPIPGPCPCPCHGPRQCGRAMRCSQRFAATGTFSWRKLFVTKDKTVENTRRVMKRYQIEVFLKLLSQWF